MSQASESPLETLYRRRPSLRRPPIRSVNSPRLTEDEADQLTSPFLNYSTGYTYAFSQSYDPDKPPAWEVPNINNNFVHAPRVSSARVSSDHDQEYVEHAAAPSLMRKLGQTVSDAFHAVLNTIIWAFYSVTVRPLKALGLLFYDIVEGAFYLTRNLSESISDCVYEHAGGYRHPYRRRSLYEILVIAMFKLVSGIFSILRWPVDLVAGLYREASLLLTRKYYELLAEKGRKAHTEAVIKKFRAMNKETAEITRWRLMRKAEQESAAKYDWNGGNHNYDDNDPNDPDRRFYNLRSRNLAAFDTDSEDDDVTPRRRKTVRFDTVPSETTYGGSDFRKASMATRIATWLGSMASSVVYYMLSGADFALKCVKAPYRILTGEVDSDYVTPSNSAEEVYLHGRHSHVRRMTAGADEDYEDEDRELYMEPEPSPLLSRFMSFCSTVLYAPCRAFLFITFAVVDLMRWLLSRVTSAPRWLWENASYLVDEMFSRRRRWLWWLLPLFLLLLLALTPRNSDDQLTLFGHKVSDVPDRIKNYASNIMDSEGHYAKSLNSIYDEYWKNGRFGKYDLFTRLTSAVSNGWLYAFKLVRSVYDLLNAIVSDSISFVVDLVSRIIRLAYPKKTLEPSFNMPHEEDAESSTLVGPSPLTKYLTAPNMSFWKSSAYSLASNAGKLFYDFLSNIKDVGSFLTSGVQQTFRLLFNIILYPFTRVLPELSSSLKSSALAACSTAEKYLQNSLMALVSMGGSLVQYIFNILRWCGHGLSSLFLLGSSPLNRHQVTRVDERPVEQTIDTISQSLNVGGATTDEPKVVYVPSPTASIDEKKMIDRITAIVHAKMDQDLRTKLETELKSLKESYEEKILSLKQEKSRAEIDYTQLESLIHAAISEYDSDKTGMFDFALESAGASIISTRCSENYNTYSRLEKIWNIPLWYSSYGPRTVIQRNSKTLFPGECWSFKGPVGYITIGLSHPINITIFSYEHIGAHQAPGGQRPSCPKTFKLWAYKSEADMDTRVLLGDFMYDIKGPPLQFFVIKTQPDYPVKIIEMEVTSNYGAEYTSLYRLRVHGSLWKPGNE